MGKQAGVTIRQEIIDYLDQTQWAALATVRPDGTPVVRTIGAFALGEEGTRIYFATLPNADKTHHIDNNNRVSFFFQHEGQALPEFRNAEVLGRAARINSGTELEQVVHLITERSPFVKDLVEKHGAGIFAYYEVIASELKFLDYRKGIGPQALETIIL